MADVNKEIALKVTTDTSQTNTALKSAEERLTEAKKAMLDLAMAGKQGSKEFRALAVEAGALKGKIESVEQTVDGLGKSANKIEVFTGAVQGIAAGFAIAQGTAALFAEGNEELQQALVKVQASLALLQGTEQAVQLLRRESAAGQALLTARTAAYNVVVGASTGALKLFRIALVSTGIGAAVVAVGLLVANFDKVTKAVTDFVSGSPMLTKVIGFITDGFTKLGRAIGVIPSESEAATKQMIADLEKQQKLLEAAGANTTAIEKRLAELRIELAKETGEGLAEAEEELTLFNAAQEAKRVETAKEAAKKRAEIEKAAIEKSKAERLKAAEDQKAVDQIGIDAEDEKVTKAREAAQELSAIQNDIRRSKLTDYQREREDFLLQRQQMLELMRTSGASEIELQLFASNTARMMQQMDADKDVEILNATEKTKFENRQQFMVKTAEMTMQALGALTSLYTASLGQSEKDQKKAFEANKKFSIAQALISTFLAVNNALTAGGNPIKLATGAQFVEAGIALTAGLANVIKIRKTTFQSGGASGGSSISRPSAGLPSGGQQPPAAFSPNATPTTPTGQPNPMAQGQQPLRAYVVDRDIENASNRRNQLREFASI
jgi:hypothetical protein